MEVEGVDEFLEGYEEFWKWWNEWIEVSFYEFCGCSCMY